MTPRPLDILYVGTLPPHQGGSAISAAQLLGAICERGHTVRALAPATQAQMATGDPFAARHPRIAVRRFAVHAPYTTAYRPADASYQRSEDDGIRRFLPALVAERRPDVLLVGRESFAWHVPSIAAAHSLPCVLRAAGATTVGVIAGTYPRSLAAPLIEQWQRMDLVITPSNYLAGELRQLGVSKIQVILNAIDLTVFRPAAKDPRLLAQLGIREGATVIAYIGNLNERKRPLDLVHSSSHVLARSPDVVYLIVGDGTLREAAIDAARGLGVQASFRFVGWQGYEQIPTHINASDIVVLPSFGEGLARVYLETQACARVLIASDTGPAREVVTDGETGLLFPVGDVGALAERSILAVQDAGLRAQIGRAARERVQRHEIGTAVTQYLDALERLVWASSL
ncbi:MAG: glycosyltransferase family 4 protein [Candidatus Binatia bacterium]